MILATKKWGVFFRGNQASQLRSRSTRYRVAGRGIWSEAPDAAYFSFDPIYRSTGSYFKKVGNITVRYVLANEYLEKGEISDVRTVVVQDVDECTYEGPRAEVCLDFDGTPP